MMGFKGALFGLAMALELAGGVAEQQEPANKGGEPKATGKTDLYGDPLPEGAMARLGTIRFRHDIRPRMVAFAAGGKVLVSVGMGGYGVILWDALSGRPLHRLSVPAVAFSVSVAPDGKTLVTDNLVFIDIATGKEKRRLLQGGQNLAEVVWSPDGKTVAREVLGQQKIVLWDVETGQQLRTLEIMADVEQRFAFSPDSKLLASGSNDNTVRLWDVATGKEVRRFATVPQQFHAPLFAPSGKVLVVVGEPGVIQMWDLGTGKLRHQFKGQERFIGGISFSPDGQVLATGGHNLTSTGGIILWNTETGKELRRWTTDAVGSLEFSPDGKVLVSCGGGGPSIHRWDPATGKEIDPPAGHTGPISSMRFAPDGKSLTGARFWQNSRVGPSHQQGSAQLQAEDILPRDEKVGWTVKARSLDGKTVALSGFYVGEDFQAKYDPRIRVWDAVAGKEIFTLPGNAKLPPTVAFSPDGKTLATSSADGTRLWDAATGKEVRRLHKNPGISLLVFSPDGTLLADCATDNIVRLWDIATGKELRQWDMLRDLTGNVVFSPDGKVILSLNSLRAVRRPE